MTSTLKLDIFFRNLLLALIIIYFSQGALYPQGSIFSQGALVLLLGVSGFYFVRVILLRNLPGFIKAWTALILLNILSFLITAQFLTDSSLFDYLKNTLITLLPIFPFYYFSIIGIFRVKHFLIYLFFMLPISILQFFYQQSMILESSASENIVNNAAYVFVGMIPFVFLIKRRILASACLLVMSYFIIMSAKRGALIVGALGLLLYAYYQLRTIPRRDQFRATIVIFLGFTAMTIFTIRTYGQNEFLQQRMQGLEEGQYSRRDVIYANIFNNWTNSDNYIQLIFGYGFKGSTKLSGTGNVAHNDWLELLANFGILGVFVYASLFYYLFKSSFNPNWSKDKRLLLLSITLIWFVTTLFSMGYTSNSLLGAFILTAYLMGTKSKNLV